MHKKECKALETGFDQSCDCGEYEQRQKVIKGSHDKEIPKLFAEAIFKETESFGVFKNPQPMLKEILSKKMSGLNICQIECPNCGVKLKRVSFTGNKITCINCGYTDIIDKFEIHNNSTTDEKSEPTESLICSVCKRVEFALDCEGEKCSKECGGVLVLKEKDTFTLEEIDNMRKFLIKPTICPQCDSRLWPLKFNTTNMRRCPNCAYEDVLSNFEKCYSLKEDIKRRMGKFAIDLTTIYDYNKTPILYEIFGMMIILRTNYLFHKNCIEYIAKSPLFEELPEGQILNEYKLSISGDKWKFTKIDNA